MTTSGNYLTTVTRDDIIKFALRKIGVWKRGQTLSAADTSEAAFALNLIIKQLQDKSDGAPSVKMWLRKRLVLFLQNNQGVYHIGSSAADYCAAEDDLLETTLSVAAASGASTLTLTSVTGAADTYYIGIMQDNGVIHWTTINGAPAGFVVTLTAVTTYAAAAGNAVYVFSTKVQPPLYLLTRYLRNSSGSDWEIAEMSLDKYDSLPTKTALGIPNGVYYEKTLTEGVFYFDNYVSDATHTFRMTVHYPAQDMTAAGETFDFPDIWLRPLGYLLGTDLAPEYDIELTQTYLLAASDAMKIARDSDPETSDLVFEPGRD